MSILTDLQERSPAGVLQVGALDDGKPLMRVAPQALPQIAGAAKELGFAHLACITGVDYPDEHEIEVIYNLYNYDQRENLVLKARTSRDEARLPSVSGVWRAALFLERETYDLLGVRFEGHPDLKRILLPEPWVGHPLRKDYEMNRQQFVSKGPQGEDVVSFDPQEGW